MPENSSQQQPAAKHGAAGRLLTRRVYVPRGRTFPAATAAAVAVAVPAPALLCRPIPEISTGGEAIGRPRLLPGSSSSSRLARRVLLWWLAELGRPAASRGTVEQAQRARVRVRAASSGATACASMTHTHRVTRATIFSRHAYLCPAPVALSHAALVQCSPAPRHHRCCHHGPRHRQRHRKASHPGHHHLDYSLMARAQA